MRIFHKSQCHRCIGVRYIRGKHEQMYLMCKLRSTRYLPQPQLDCTSYTPSMVSYLSWHGVLYPNAIADQSYDPNTIQRLAFTWMVKSPTLKLKFIGTESGRWVLTDLDRPEVDQFIKKMSQTPASQAPHWSFIYHPDTHSFTWTTTPQKAIVLGWLIDECDQLNTLMTAPEINISPYPHDRSTVKIEQR